MALIRTDEACESRPAIFLDKDGTILEDVPYNVDPRRMRLAPGAGFALRALGMLGLPLVVVSNQPGVALGYFTREALDDVLTRLAAMFREHGARLAGFYWCPHHPKGQRSEYAVECLCRKPLPGLLQQAARDLSIDLSRSWMVGDILHDVEAGRRAGCQTVLIDNGNETEWVQDRVERHPHFTVPDMSGAAEVILDAYGAREAAQAAARRGRRQAEVMR